MPVFAWVTWAKRIDGRKVVKKTMFANGDKYESKRKIRSELTQKFIEEGKMIRKMTLRRFTSQPCWLSDQAWTKIIDGGD